ncbi:MULTISPECIES: SDR family NAD(P)-dependent oxidoreductase [Promicromonospora]|uniref:SDR family NAD(P)-dependent oxidoreductase n=2 Tax=Promicromonospora TaxID=43676 RepID=A0ABW4V3Y3_9MICO
MVEAARTALVIGASRGIGAATARGLLKVGYRTAGTHRGGGSVPTGTVGIEMDVRDAGSISAGVREAVALLGRLDVLVVAAGITRDKLLLRMSEQDLSEVMQVNAIGPMLACKAALEPMMRQRDGSIVLVSSISVKYGVAGQCNYTASKGALEAFARSMAREYADRNIRVNVVAPGATDTDMMANVSQQARAAMLEGIPLKRLGTADEMASAIIHTAENTYMSGATIPVAGGI